MDDHEPSPEAEQLIRTIAEYERIIRKHGMDSLEALEYRKKHASSPGFADLAGRHEAWLLEARNIRELPPEERENRINELADQLWQKLHPDQQDGPNPPAP